MDAGPSSAPILHELQPPVRAQAPRPAPNRVPGAPPNGVLRPPVMQGQRRGPTVVIPRRVPLPPPTFRFQTVEKRPVMNMPPSNRTPTKLFSHPSDRYTHSYMSSSSHPRIQDRPSSFMAQNKRFLHESNGRMQFIGGNHSMMPSTSYSERTMAPKPPPVYRTPPPSQRQTFEMDCMPTDEPEITLNVVDKAQTTIELPPNCKLFQYSCEVGGVQRTLLVPMPSNATEEDVMKMLPDSFSEMAATIFQKELDMSPEELPRLSLPMAEPPREEPTLVNPKQYFRIQKRRDTRMRLEMSGRLPMQRQKYLHESRHRHAISRKRGVDGRFDPKLRAEEEPNVSTPTGPQYRAQPLARPARTYAAIRPANDMNNQYGRLSPGTVRRLEPVQNASAAGPSSSMPSTSGSSYFEPITSFQQYQQHVQYPSGESRDYQSTSGKTIEEVLLEQAGPSTSEAATIEGNGAAAESDQHNFMNL